MPRAKLSRSRHFQQMMESNQDTFRVSWPSTAPLAKKILLLLGQSHISLEDSDFHLERLNSIHLKRIETAIHKNDPIHLVLPAFPAKSSNREKTISDRVDMGEVIALMRLNELCKTIGTLYAPGAKLTICSDGRVFADLVGVTDSHVDEYRRGIEGIISRFHLNRLSTYNLEEYFPHCDHHQMRAFLIQKFSETPEAIEEFIKSTTEGKNLFNGIHRFIFEDQVANESQSSRNQVRQRSKTVAKNVIRMSQAWSRIVDQQFPSAVRLSIHPHSAETGKFGIKLIPGGGKWATPWHNALVCAGGQWFLTKKSEAQAMGASLQYGYGHYAYYNLDGSL